MIKIVKWKDVKEELLAYYPNQTETIELYESMFNNLKQIIPKNTNMRLSIVEFKEKDEKWIDISGYNGTLNKDLEENKGRTLDPDFSEKEVSYGIEFEPWDVWLGMDIDRETIRTFTPEQIVAYSLWEMSFVSFDENKIKEEKNNLIEQVRDIKEKIDKGEDDGKTFDSVEDMLKDIFGKDENGEEQLC